MDFLEKLDYLMNKNNLNKSTLSKACDIPYTTVDGWYKRGYEGLKLPTLKKLSNYFGISLDYWADDNLVEPVYKDTLGMVYNNEEINLIKKYRQIDNDAKSQLMNYLDYEIVRNNQLRRLRAYAEQLGKITEGE